jgi:hypothetical protein
MVNGELEETGQVGIGGIWVEGKGGKDMKLHGLKLKKTKHGRNERVKGVEL